MVQLLGRLGSRKEQRDELLSAYLDGELDERERRHLEARLAQDETLREELRELRQTVSLMRQLPQVAAPRNFILSKSMVDRRQPAPRPEAQALRPSSKQARRGWAAPLLTAATAVVSLLFVVVLAGDLLLPGIGGLASAPEPVEQAKEMPQIALEAAPAGDEVEIEREVAISPTSAPMAEAKAPGAEPEMVVEEEEGARIEDEVALSPTVAPTLAVEAPREQPEVTLEEEALEEMQASEAPLETGTPSALTAAGGGGPTEESVAALAAPTAEPMVAPTAAWGAVLTSAVPTEPPAVAEKPAERELGLPEPTSDETKVRPSVIPAEDRGMEAPVRGRLPWEVLEIGLAVAAVVLTFTTVRAWRIRRR